MKPKVTIISYGTGNLFSLACSFKYCGAEVLFTDDPLLIEKATLLVIPGVGAFGDCMERLREKKLIAPILNCAKNGTKILGICVGMQMLFDESEEFGYHSGLGLLSGKVMAFPITDSLGNVRRVPHIGWSKLKKNKTDCDSFIFGKIEDGNYCYFAHSYFAVPVNKSNILTTSCYHDICFCSGVQKNNILGCQFHPEKSSEVGLKIIKNFIEM